MLMNSSTTLCFSSPGLTITYRFVSSGHFNTSSLDNFSWDSARFIFIWKEERADGCTEADGVHRICIIDSV